jgi:hypothetical protein
MLASPTAACCMVVRTRNHQMMATGRAVRDRLLSRALLAWYVAVCLYASLVLLTKVGLLESAFHDRLPRSLLYLAMTAAALVPFFVPTLMAWKAKLFPIILLGIALFAFIIYPKVESLHGAGRGSDQATCIIVAVNRIAVGLQPYSRDAMWSHNNMSCGPGWVLLFLPLTVALGYPFVLLAMLLCLFLLAYRRWGIGKVYEFALACALFPGFWWSIANGSDFLVFGLALVVIDIVMSDAPRRRRSDLALGCRYAFVSLVAQFRAPFLAMPILFYRESNAKGLMACISLGVLLTLWGGAWALAPDQFVSEGPFHVFAKLNAMLAHFGVLPPYLSAVVIVLAAVAPAVLLVRFDVRHRLLLYVAVLLLPMIAVDLFGGLFASSGLWAGLERSEGTMWLCALLPILSWKLVDGPHSTSCPHPEVKPV